MSAKASIAPRSYGSPPSSAGSPPSSGSTPRPIVSNLLKPGSTPPSAANSPPANNIITSSINRVQVQPNNNTTTSTTHIITSKEWVLPPRPKPGRKPSVDTPASKRKAQNRAAQRAFRERRATRVQELEEKLMEQEKEKEIKELALINTINKLKVENQFLLKNLEQMKSEIGSLKTNQAKLNQQQKQISQPHGQVQIASNNQQPQQQQQVQQQPFKATFSLGGFSAHNSPISQPMGSPASSNYSVQQISPAPSADSPPGYSSNTSYLRHNSINKSTTSLNAMTANTTPDKNNQTKQSIDSSNFDCGICLKDECLCETVGLKDPKPEDSQKVLDEKLKSFKPMAAVSLSSKKKRPVSAMNDNVKEIDFTQKFKSKPMPDLKKLKKSASVSNGFEFNENSPVENCGFCSDDTPCVCREAAKEAALINENLNRQASVTTNSEMGTKSLPPIQVDLNNGFRKSSLPVMHPGPSVEISNIANLTPGAVPNVVTPTTRRSDSVSSMIKNSSTTDLSEEKSSNSDGGCTGNPGTCRQCQMDPMSTLFCTTVASKNQAPTSATVAGGILSRSGSKTNLPSFTSLNAGTNSSTTSSMNSRPSTPGPNSSNSGIFIPCADAYKTLSRHKNFNSADFGTLVGKLTTRGMQVEVQSVANVLRELDRRLYN